MSQEWHLSWINYQFSFQLNLLSIDWNTTNQAGFPYVLGCPIQNPAPRTLRAGINVMSSFLYSLHCAPSSYFHIMCRYILDPRFMRRTSYDLPHLSRINAQSSSPVIVELSSNPSNFSRSRSISSALSPVSPLGKLRNRIKFPFLTCCPSNVLFERQRGWW